MNAIAPEDIADDESLAAFALESNKIKPDGIHWHAFRPSPDGQRSVFRVRDLSHAEIAALGQEHVANPRAKTIVGWGTVGAGVARAKPPLTVRDDPPPPKHAVIEGWPSAPEKQKT